MRPHRRTLHSETGLGDGDCHDPYACDGPPPPTSFGPVPATSPSPPPRLSPCQPPGFPAPSPTPAHGTTGGRRDQGRTPVYGPPPGGPGHGDRRHFVTYVLAAAAAIAFVSLILLGVSVAVRRRQVRRRRQALLAGGAAPAGAANAGDGGDDPEGGGGGGGVVHHIWYIRTVGLDEAAINSIAVTRYHAGAGLLGAADCSVCLGEFQDGDLVRLLPKCGHAFHVPCIDTWLRAHVNCPLCRSDVLLDPAVTAAARDSGGGGETISNPPADPDVNANVTAEQAAAASDAVLERQDEARDNQEPSPAEDQREQSSPLEPLPRNVRRAASMDAAMVSTAQDVAALERLPEAAPEEEQVGGRRKRGTGLACAKASGSGHWSNPSTDRPPSGGVPRSFFSRHCRARSSVLPL